MNKRLGRDWREWASLVILGGLMLPSKTFREVLVIAGALALAAGIGALIGYFQTII